MTRSEAQGTLVRLLMDKIRGDRYPSVTHMTLVEEMLPRRMAAEYLGILMDKAAEDTYPSIPMLQRIRRVAGTLPLVEQTDE